MKALTQNKLKYFYTDFLNIKLSEPISERFNGKSIKEQKTYSNLNKEINNQIQTLKIKNRNTNKQNVTKS